MALPFLRTAETQIFQSYSHFLLFSTKNIIGPVQMYLKTLENVSDKILSSHDAGVANISYMCKYKLVTLHA